MKSFKFLSILVALVITTFSITSCVDDNDYIIPTPKGTSQSLNAVLEGIKNGSVTEISIADLKKKFFKTREANKVKGNYVVKGYVTSSDESGNFYKEFYMQDAPENPTAGIKVALELTNSHNQYNIGREVYIQLNGLYIGETRVGDKDATIGGFVKTDGTNLEPISEKQYKNLKHILRSEKTETIVPLPITFSAITEANLGMFVMVDNAQFKESDREQTYFDPARDYDTERTLVSCEGTKKGEFILETSSFANFGSSKIPSGGGSISAVVTKDYNRNLRLAINTVKDVKMDGEICSSATTPVPSNTKTIAELRKLFKGSAVTITEDTKIKAVVTSDLTSGNISNKNAFVQDASGAIALRFSDVYDLKIGEEIEVAIKGLKLSKFGDLLQLNLATSNIVKKSAGTLPKPKVITIAQALTGKYQAQLVKIENVQFKDVTKKYSGSNKITDCAKEIVTYVSDRATFKDKKVATKKGYVTGVITTFKSKPQLYIRNTSDVNFTKTYGCNSTGTPTTTTKKTVSDVRNLFTGSSTTITENAKIKVIVTSDATTKNINGRNAFVQDATAGIALRFDANHNLKLGEEVEISIKDVTLSEFGGLLQLNVKNANVLTQKAGALPTPKTITITQALSGNYEAQLVKIEGVQFKDSTKKYAKANTLTSNCTNVLATYVNDNATFANDQVSAKKGTVTGVMTEFRNKAQIYLRNTTDVNFTETYGCGSTGTPTTTTEKTVSDVRNLFTGSNTTITENAKIKVIVTSDATTKNINGRNAFVQDATAGIALRFDANHNLKLGEEVEISIKDVTLSEFGGLLQLNVTNANVLTQKAGALPTPKTITITQALSGNYEAQLVKIEGVQFKDNTKKYAKANTLTSNCTDELATYVNDNATFANDQVSVKKGTVTGVMTEFSNKAQIYLRNTTTDVNFTNAYTTCGNTGGGDTGGGTTSGKFDFEDLTTSATSYSGTGTLTATDGTKLEYKARTSLGSYKINGKGLMMKNRGYIKVTFPNGVKQLKFKYRGAFTNTTDRVVIVNEGDESSTTELKKVTFPYNTTSEIFTLDLNKTGSYTITIKGGTSRQIVIDDIEWTK